MTTIATKPIDAARLEAFVGQAVVDMGAAISGLLLHIGDRLGLYKAMAGAGPITSASLAARTGTAERYVREWLGNQAAGGYVVYNPADGTFELPAEQAMVVADEDSPVILGGAFPSPTAGRVAIIPGPRLINSAARARSPAAAARSPARNAASAAARRSRSASLPKCRDSAAPAAQCKAAAAALSSAASLAACSYRPCDSPCMPRAKLSSANMIANRCASRRHSAFAAAQPSAPRSSSAT